LFFPQTSHSDILRHSSWSLIRFTLLAKYSDPFFILLLSCWVTAIYTPSIVASKSQLAPSSLALQDLVILLHMYQFKPIGYRAFVYI